MAGKNNKKTQKPLAVIVLAAGKGTRMRSGKAKVLHKIGGLPMIAHVLRAAEKLKPKKIVVVIGPGMKDVAAAVKPHATAVQKTQAGTGDAVKAALPALRNFSGDILVLYGDVPLVRTDELQALVARRRAEGAGIAIGVMNPEDPSGYGRVILNKDGTLKQIIEEKDANPGQRTIGLCNTGLMCADGVKLPGWIAQIKSANRQKEYYLTDLPAIAAKEKIKTAVVEIEEDSMTGVNNRFDLAYAENIFQNRKRLEMLAAGVTLTDPVSVYFSWDTKIAADVTIEPHVFFGPGVEIETGSVIKAFSHLEGAKIGKNASIGPFARLRPDTVLGDSVRVGNFVEIKKSKIGKGAKINHLAYVGDTVMGEDVNFSAGAITVNYDGFDKHKTVIGKNVMVGSNVNLVAPVTVKDGAFIAAGSTITHDVPAGALSVAREHQQVRKGWAVNFRKRKTAGKTRKS